MTFVVSCGECGKVFCELEGEQAEGAKAAGVYVNFVCEPCLDLLKREADCEPPERDGDPYD